MHPVRLATRLLAVASLFSGLLLIPHRAYAQGPDWERVDTFGSDALYSVAFRGFLAAPDGTTLFFTGDGLYRIEALSGEKEEITYLGSTLYAHPLGIVNGRFYAVNEAGLFSSNDRGDSWAYLTASGPVESFLASDDHLLVNDYINRQLYPLSLDGTRGEARQYDERIVQVLLTSGGTLYGLTNGNIESGPLHVSKNLGETWAAVNATWPDGVERLDHLYELSSDIIAVSTDGGTILSDDGGESWRTVDPPFEPSSSLLMTDDGTLWTVRFEEGIEGETDYELYGSVDTGLSWSLCSHTFLSFRRDGTAYGFEGGYVMSAKGCAGSPVSLTGRITNVHVRGLVASPDGSLYAWINGSGKGDDLYRSLDEGETWDLVRRDVLHLPEIGPQGNLYLAVDTLVPAPPGASVDSVTRVRPVGSTDRGETWRPLLEDSISFDRFTQLDFQFDSDGTVLLLPRPSDGQTGIELPVVYIAESGRDFIPLDGWTDTGTFRLLDAHLFNDGMILATGSRWWDERDYRDNGFLERHGVTGEITWIGGPDVHAISSDGDLFAWSPRDIYRFDRETGTFTELPLPPGGGRVQRSVVERGSRVYTYGERDTLWMTTDDGMTWEALPERVTEWSSFPLPPWERVTPPLPARPDGTLFDLVRVYQDDPWRSIRLPVHDFTTLARSVDGGETWDYPVSEELIGRDITAVAFAGTTIIVGTANHGIYRADFPSGVEGEARIVPVWIDLR